MPSKPKEVAPPPPPTVQSTISKFKDMYLSNTDAVDNAGVKKKVLPATTSNTRFGCATLPTKLKQSAPYAGQMFASRQTSVPQMHRKLSPTKSKSTFNGVNKLEARRQVSAPQIGNRLPEEVRQVYERIKGGQKVVTMKNKDAIKIEKMDASPRLGNHQPPRDTAFKPASHFSEVRGYENAVPSQICVSFFQKTLNFHSVQFSFSAAGFRKQER